MSIEPNGSSSGRQRSYRYVVVTLVVLVLGAIFYMGAEIRKQEPDFYSPGRAALVNARLRFEESMQYEQELIKQQKKSRDGLNLAIKLLSQTKNLDPADRADIEDMQRRIKAIEVATLPGDTSAQQLQKQYRALLEQMDALITKIESH